MRRRAILLAGAVVCIGAAVFLVLVARDAGRVGTAMRADTPEAPNGLARSLLAVDDDLAFRQAVSLFRRAHIGIPSFDQSAKAIEYRIQAEAALARVIRAGGERTRSSKAANLLGVLALLDATSPTATPTPIERSVFEFQDAIRLDPANQAAKANLELAFGLTPPPNTFHGLSPQKGTSRFGASSGGQGHGY